MEVPNYLKCDACGVEKPSASGWLLAITIPPTEAAPGMEGIAFAPVGTPVNDPDIKLEHLCCHGCAIKRFSQWLGEL